MAGARQALDSGIPNGNAWKGRVPTLKGNAADAGGPLRERRQLEPRHVPRQRLLSSGGAQDVFRACEQALALLLRFEPI